MLFFTLLLLLLLLIRRRRGRRRFRIRLILSDYYLVYILCWFQILFLLFNFHLYGLFSLCVTLRITIHAQRWNVQKSHVYILFTLLLLFHSVFHCLQITWYIFDQIKSNVCECPLNNNWNKTKQISYQSDNQRRLNQKKKWILDVRKKKKVQNKSGKTPLFLLFMKRRIQSRLTCNKYLNKKN